MKRAKPIRTHEWIELSKGYSDAGWYTREAQCKHCKVLKRTEGGRILPKRTTYRKPSKGPARTTLPLCTRAREVAKAAKLKARLRPPASRVCAQCKRRRQPQALERSKFGQWFCTAERECERISNGWTREQARAIWAEEDAIDEIEIEAARVAALASHKRWLAKRLREHKKGTR